MVFLAQTEPAAPPSNTGGTDIAGFHLNTDQVMRLVETYGVDLVKVIVLLFVGYIVAGWVNRIVVRSCDRAKIEMTLGKFFGKLARWTVLLLVGIFVLSVFGIQTASFAVVIGAAGLAIGLAFQGTLSNFASGVMLLIFRPFKVDDFVDVAGQKGKINELELFTTTMDTPDNRRIIIPNSAIFGSVIENYSYHPTRRVDVNVGVEYSADIDKTREVLTKAAHAIEGRIDEPASAIVLLELGDSSVNWVVRVWCKTPDFWDVRDRLTREVKMQLDQAGIGIPFPQMDVHLDKAGDA